MNAATLKTLASIKTALRTTGVASMAKFNMVHMRRLEAAGLIVLDSGYWSVGLPG